MTTLSHKWRPRTTVRSIREEKDQNNADFAQA